MQKLQEESSTCNIAGYIVVIFFEFLITALLSGYYMLCFVKYLIKFRWPFGQNQIQAVNPAKAGKPLVVSSIRTLPVCFRRTFSFALWRCLKKWLLFYNLSYQQCPPGIDSKHLLNLNQFVRY